MRSKRRSIRKTRKLRNHNKRTRNQRSRRVSRRSRNIRNTRKLRKVSRRSKNKKRKKNLIGGTEGSHDKVTLIPNKDYEIHEACKKNDKDTVISLLETATNVNISDHEGNTPLHIACSMENYNIVKLLIKKGASVTIRNNEGKTPLHIACDIDDSLILTYLLQECVEENFEQENNLEDLFDDENIIKYSQYVQELIKKYRNRDEVFNLETVKLLRSAERRESDTSTGRANIDDL